MFHVIQLQTWNVLTWLSILLYLKIVFYFFLYIYTWCCENDTNEQEDINKNYDVIYEI